MWAAQDTLAVPNASPTPAMYLPGEADLPFDFIAPGGIDIPVAQHARIQPGPGCGSVYWGVLDSESATISADGTVVPLRPGAVLAFAQQDGKRKYLQIAAVADPAPAKRFGPPAGWVLDTASDAVTVATTGPGFNRLWQDWTLSIQSLTSPIPDWAPLGPSPAPRPSPPAVDFSRYAVLGLSMTLDADEGDPVVTHVDAQGLHVVIPDASGAGRVGRRVVALYRVPTVTSDAPVLFERHHRDRPLPARSPAPVMPSPPLEREAPDCVPDWAWTGTPHDVSVDIGDQVGVSDAQGFPIPAKQLAVGVGRPLYVVGRSTLGPTTFSLNDPSLGTIEPNAYGIPMASGMGPPQPGAPNGIPYGATLTARAPGALLLTASAGGKSARALIACVGSPAPGLAFKFLREPQLAPGLTAGPRVILDAASWQAFWEAAMPALAGVRPTVDFSTYSVVALVDDRVSYGERGDVVLVSVGPGGKQVQLVAPGVEAYTTPPRHRRELDLFLTGRLAADAVVKLSTLCAP